MDALTKIGVFLLEHADIFDLLIQALTGGTPKEHLMRAIRQAQVDASDAQMRLELGELARAENGG